MDITVKTVGQITVVEIYGSIDENTTPDVFVNGKRAHLIIENGPTWGIKGSAVIIENEPI